MWYVHESVNEQVVIVDKTPEKYGDDEERVNWRKNEETLMLKITHNVEAYDIGNS